MTTPREALGIGCGYGLTDDEIDAILTALAPPSATPLSHKSQNSLDEQS